MARKNTFTHQFGRPTVYKCGVCKRSTRDTGDNGGTELCPQCFELAGIENTFSDADASELPRLRGEYRAEVVRHIDKIRKKGGNTEQWDDLLRQVNMEEEPEMLPDNEERFSAMLENILNMEEVADCGIKSVKTFDEAGIATKDEGLVVKLANGRKFFITIQQG